LDLESLPYLLLLALCFAYIAAYARTAITHPTVIFFSFVLFYFPLKYFLIKLGGFEYAYYPDKLGALSQSNAIAQGGMLLSIYLFLSALFHQLLRSTRLAVPVLSVKVRLPLMGFSVALGVAFLAAFSLIESPAALLDGLKFRVFTTQGGMGYLLIVYELTVVVALSQALDARKYAMFLALFVFHAAFGILGGRTAPIVNMILLTVIYLFMVRRYVPTKTLAAFALVVPVFALLHGIVRVRGDLSAGIDYLIEAVGDSKDILSLVTTNLIERIDQLEEFAVLSSAVLGGSLPADPLWPTQVFSQFLPRAFWPDKPPFFNAQMMGLFYPEVLADNVTFNFLGIGEFIYSFHLAGMLPAVLVTGYLLHVFDRYAALSKDNSGVLVFFFVVPHFVLNAGFHVGWMNTPVMPTALIGLLVLFSLGKLRFVRDPARSALHGGGRSGVAASPQ